MKTLGRWWVVAGGLVLAGVAGASTSDVEMVRVRKSTGALSPQCSMNMNLATNIPATALRTTNTITGVDALALFVDPGTSNMSWRVATGGAGGTGDVQIAAWRAVYDTNSNGRVDTADNAETVDFLDSTDLALVGHVHTETNSVALTNRVNRFTYPQYFDDALQAVQMQMLDGTALFDVSEDNGRVFLTVSDAIGSAFYFWTSSNFVPVASDTYDWGGYYNGTLYRFRNVYASNVVADAVTLGGVERTTWPSGSGLTNVIDTSYSAGDSNATALASTKWGAEGLATKSGTAHTHTGTYQPALTGTITTCTETNNIVRVTFAASIATQTVMDVWLSDTLGGGPVASAPNGGASLVSGSTLYTYAAGKHLRALSAADGTLGVTWTESSGRINWPNLALGANWYHGDATVWAYEGFLATGGTITNYTENGTNFTAHIFTNSGTFTVSGQGTNCDVLVVAGGGGGGSTLGGGGGGGGLISSQAFDVAVGNYDITVGLGGAGAANRNVQGDDGSNSVFAGLTATGGGGGGSYASPNGRNGGSGGGAGTAPAFATKGSGVVGQGFDGGTNQINSSALNGAAGGGGGATLAGSDGAYPSSGAGGDGAASSLRGYSATYSGGGGGGAGVDYSSSNAGAGGSGGGGAGGVSAIGQNGTANSGGGGGGGGFKFAGLVDYGGGNGGSGIVIVRYVTLTP